MKNIQVYESFCLNESEKLFFKRHNQPESYKKRSKDSYGLSDDPTILQKTRDFFQKVENRINNMAREGSNIVKSNRASRGGGPDTGVETLFGIFSVVPNVLKRVFGPTNYSFGKSAPKDDSVDLEFMRHTNEEFAKKDLPNIRSEKQLEDNVADLYQKGGVKRGQSPVLDDIARNRANLYYTREKNPNQPIFK
jgi:hypothetical protein